MRRTNRRVLVGRVELDRLGPAAAVHVTAELLALGHPPHGSHHLIAHDESTDVPAPALGDELLDEHILLGAL